jgi:hypothetical protein
MKPILIIPPDTIDAEGIKALNDNGICCVVATDPSSVQFADPENSGYFAECAVRFTRVMLNQNTFIQNNQWHNLSMDEVARLFTVEAKKGTPFSREHQDKLEAAKRIIENAKLDEEAKIAREEAREEAAQRRAEKAAAKSSKKAV